MDNEFRDRRTKNYGVMRSLVDYTMGILYIGVASFLFFAEKFGYDMEYLDKTFRYVFGGLLAIYGFWRIYRGFKKNYF